LPPSSPGARHFDQISAAERRKTSGHHASLHLPVLEEFLKFIERSRGLKITIERAEVRDE